MPYTIDLNCDMGEGMANDAQLMPLISSANIACGYHAGDARSIQHCIELAMQHQVHIGAHPSFPDRANFGRTNMHFPATEIRDMVKKQVALLADLAVKNHARLHHVKPHGALYNMASKDPVLSEAICSAMLDIDPSLLLYAQSGSVLYSVAQSMQIKTRQEVFADRSYQPDGSLTPRSLPNALLQKEQDVVAQVLQMVRHQSVHAEGKDIPVVAETICIHGDGAHALDFATAIVRAFRENGVVVA